MPRIIQKAEKLSDEERTLIEKYRKLPRRLQLLMQALMMHSPQEDAKKEGYIEE